MAIKVLIKRRIKEGKTRPASALRNKMREESGFWGKFPPEREKALKQ
jgi:hypothetical protein